MEKEVDSRLLEAFAALANNVTSLKLVGLLADLLVEARRIAECRHDGACVNAGHLRVCMRCGASYNRNSWPEGGDPITLGAWDRPALVEALVRVWGRT